MENLAEEFSRKNHGQKFLINDNQQEITEYIIQRKEDYAKSKEREREAAKVKARKKIFIFF